MTIVLHYFTLSHDAPHLGEISDEGRHELFKGCVDDSTIYPPRSTPQPTAPPEDGITVTWDISGDQQWCREEEFHPSLRRHR